jgi:peptidyl-dipeptidase Dcp
MPSPGAASPGARRGAASSNSTRRPRPAAAAAACRPAAPAPITSTLDYLGPAIVEMKLHLMSDGTPGRVFYVVKFENETLAALGMPPAWDEVMRMPHNWHAMSDFYGAGLHVYIWADVMAADAAEAFVQAPGGWYDDAVSTRWRETVLAVGTSVPAEEAFRNFRGRDPDPDALLRRFGLIETRPRVHEPLR